MSLLWLPVGPTSTEHAFDPVATVPLCLSHLPVIWGVESFLGGEGVLVSHVLSELLPVSTTVQCSSWQLFSGIVMPQLTFCNSSLSLGVVPTEDPDSSLAAEVLQKTAWEFLSKAPSYHSSPRPQKRCVRV